MNAFRLKKPIAFLLIVALMLGAVLPSTQYFTGMNESVYAEDKNQTETPSDVKSQTEENALVLDLSKYYRPVIYINAANMQTFISGDNISNNNDIPEDIITSGYGIITKIIIKGDCEKNPDFDSSKGMTIYTPLYYRSDTTLTLELDNIDLIGSISLKGGPEKTVIQSKGSNYITSPDGSTKPPIEMTGQNDLELRGDGILNVTASDLSKNAPPAIGTAYSNYYFADLYIYSGIVNVKAYGGAGIGSAMNNQDYTYGNGGRVYINGGVVNAYSVSGAGIGGGYKAQHMPKIYMKGGEVNAYSSETAILGSVAYCKTDQATYNHSFKGGIINAESYYGSAIGNSRNKNISGEILFDGTTVNAKSEKNTAIAGAYHGVDINSGFITAEGSDDSGYYDISCTNNDDFGGINIKGGSVYLKNNKTSHVPRCAYKTEGFRTIIPATGHGKSLKDSSFSYKLKDFYGNTQTYKGNTVSQGSSNEHGSDLSSTIAAIIYMPVGFTRDINVGNYDDGMADVVVETPGSNQNIIFFPETNPDYVEYSLPTVDPIPYGTRLVDSLLKDDGTVTKDGITVSGKWTMVDYNSMPLPGTTGTSVVFTPDDDSMWEIQDNVGLEVSKGDLLAYELPDIGYINFGDSLDDVELIGGRVVFTPIDAAEGIEGEWSFKYKDTKPPVGTTTTALQFIATGEDASNYNIYETDVRVTVKKRCCSHRICSNS